MKNKILFFKLILIFGAINMLQNINSMSMSDASEFADSILNQNYFEGTDAQSQIKECINLIKNYDFEVFEKYFITHNVDSNLVLELEENDDEEMDEKESKESSESYSKKDNGKSLLMFAVEKGDLRLIEFLISKGAKVNYITRDERTTALSIAVFNNNIDLAKFLIKNGADVNLDDFEVEINLNGSEFTIKSLLPLYLIGCEIKLEMVKLFLDSGYDLAESIEYQIGYNIIEFVIMLHDSSMINKQIIAMLLNQVRKSNIDLNRFDFISAALKSGKINVIKYLMKLGFININTKNDLGDNLLNCAAIAGNLELVEFAIKCGSDINYQSKDDGTSALMLACNNGHAHVVIELLNAGADINLEDEEGCSCIDHLNENNDPDGAIREILHQWSVLTAKEVIKTTGLPREISGLVVDILNNEQLSSQELAEIDRSVLKEEADKKAFVERQAARIADKISQGYKKYILNDNQQTEKPLERAVKQKKRKNIN